jgi:hypothetical protein
MLQDRVTTSYRRFSDEQWRHADSCTGRRAQTPLPVHIGEKQQLETWEGEGGKTTYVEPMRILIVDNNINTADSVELMLHAWATRELASLTPATPR